LRRVSKTPPRSKERGGGFFLQGDNMRALLFALALAACAGGQAPKELPPPPLPERAGVDPLVAARAEGIEFRAVGDGFVLDIYRADRVRLTMTSSGEELVFPKPAPVLPRWNGSIYDTAAEGRVLHVEIRNDRPCQRADRQTYPVRVDVQLDGRDMPGCGRAF
jgi:hypothetical protein